MKYVFCLIVLSFCFGTTAFAQVTSRWPVIEEISNKHSSFAVRVDVDRTDRVYARNDLLYVTVESNEEGYLYLFYSDAAGNVTMLFPNRFQKKNLIQKSESVTVPAQGSIFQIRIDDPFGNEQFKAVVSKKPLEFFANMDLTGINMLQIAEKDGKELAESVMAMKQSDWAEHHVAIRTVDFRKGSKYSTIAVVPVLSIKRKPVKLF